MLLKYHRCKCSQWLFSLLGHPSKLRSALPWHYTAYCVMQAHIYIWEERSMQKSSKERWMSRKEQMCALLLLPSLILAAVRWCSHHSGRSRGYRASHCCSSKGWRSPSQLPEMWLYHSCGTKKVSSQNSSFTKEWSLKCCVACKTVWTLTSHLKCMLSKILHDKLVF